MSIRLSGIKSDSFVSMELAYQFDNFYAEVDYYINALWFAYEYPNDRSILEIFLPNSLLVNAIPGKNTQPDNIFL